jgi:predicted 3-demethylubiquinone-9 3-methyltransferase (glyoxalase superfamily)
MAAKGDTEIFTHLWYAKEAEEAARFYASIFPDSRVNQVWSLPTDSPSGPAGSVKVVEFTLRGQRFQAMAAGPHHDFNDAISIVVLCDDQAELDRYWNALLEGGGKPQACGWLIDRCWSEMADRPDRAGRIDARRQHGPVEEGRRCDAEDGQARHRRTGKGLSRELHLRL